MFSQKWDAPGIDLGDTQAGIWFQVTATKTSEKINSTLETCIRHKCYQIYPRLKFFILSAKQSSYSINVELDGLIEFKPDQDILDFDYLYIKTMYLGLSAHKKIAEYIHEQIPYVSETIGADYYNLSTFKRLVYHFKADDWSGKNGELSLTIEHNFGYIPQVSLMYPDGTQVMADIKRDEKYLTLGSGCRWDGKVLLT